MVLVAYNCRRHRCTTPRCRRKHHPRVSNPHDKRRWRMSILATPLEVFVSPHYELAHVDLSFPSFFPRLWNFFDRTSFSRSTSISLPLGFLVDPPFWATLKNPTHLWTFYFLMFGLLDSSASSGPFPLSAHFGIHKRGRDPPTNPSGHLRKKGENSLLSDYTRKVEDEVQPSSPPLPLPPHAHMPPPLPPPPLASSPIFLVLLPLSPPPPHAPCHHHRHPCPARTQLPLLPMRLTPFTPRAPSRPRPGLARLPLPGARPAPSCNMFNLLQG